MYLNKYGIKIGRDLHNFSSSTNTFEVSQLLECAPTTEHRNKQRINFKKLWHIFTEF